MFEIELEYSPTRSVIYHHVTMVTGKTANSDNEIIINFDNNYRDDSEIVDMDEVIFFSIRPDTM